MKTESLIRDHHIRQTNLHLHRLSSLHAFPFEQWPLLRHSTQRPLSTDPSKLQCLAFKDILQSELSKHSSGPRGITGTKGRIICHQSTNSLNKNSPQVIVNWSYGRSLTLWLKDPEFECRQCYFSLTFMFAIFGWIVRRMSRRNKFRCVLGESADYEQPRPIGGSYACGHCL